MLCNIYLFFSNAQKWAKIPFLTNNEFVFFFNWEILVKKIVDLYLKNSWKHLVSSLLVRANALIQRGNAVIDEVTTSNVFLGDVQKLKAINRIRAPLQRSLENMLVEYRKNTHFLDGMEVDFKNFLITRSAGFEGSLDININREFPIVPFITRMLECLGLNIISTRSSQFHR